MTKRVLELDGVKLVGYDGGQGPVTIFQHGLGGDEAQVLEAFPDEGRRRLTLECRGHGQSEAGNLAQVSIAQFCDDVLAFADAYGVEHFAIGGISMGAAIALRIAVLHPKRVSALILVRPAWVDEAAPENMDVFAKLAPFLTNGDRAGFESSETARMLKAKGADNLKSLLGFFDRADHLNFAKVIAAISTDGPGVSAQQIAQIDVPTLVLGNALDWVHPIDLARKLAGLIPHAKFVELAPKATDKAMHIEELRAVIDAFLRQQGL